MPCCKHVGLVLYLNSYDCVRSSESLVVGIDKFHHLAYCLRLPLKEFRRCRAEIELLSLPALICCLRVEFGVGLGVGNYVCGKMSFHGISAHKTAEPEKFCLQAIFLAIVDIGINRSIAILIVILFDIAP